MNCVTQNGTEYCTGIRYRMIRQASRPMTDLNALNRIPIADTRSFCYFNNKKGKELLPFMHSKLFKRIPRAQFSVELASNRNSFYFFEPCGALARDDDAPRFSIIFFTRWKINLYRNLISRESRECTIEILIIFRFVK